MRGFGILRVAVPVLAAALLACAGCGGSGDAGAPLSLEDVAAQVGGLTGKEREARLLALAEDEGGQLTVYTSQAAGKADEIVGAFQDTYDLDVSFYRGNSETILPRLAEESAAGFHGADVVNLSGIAMASLHDDGLIDDYDSPGQRELIPGAAREGWTMYSTSSYVVTWNTELVTEDERPPSWEDLAAPRWKGKVALEAGDVDLFKTVHDYFVEDEGKSEDEADRIFQAIARNSLIVRGHTLLAQLMATGEFAVAPNYVSTTTSLIKDGAPLAWKPPVTPVIVGPNGIAPVHGARHPAAALLYIDWLLSAAGQKALVEQDYESVRPELAIVRSDQTKLIDIERLNPVLDEWTDRYDRLLRLGKELKD